MRRVVNADLRARVCAGFSEPANVRAPFQLQSGPFVALQLGIKVQVIYVLGLFLVGKNRKKASAVASAVLILLMSRFSRDQRRASLLPISPRH